MNWAIRDDHKDEWKVLTALLGYETVTLELMEKVSKNHIVATDELISRLKDYAKDHEVQLSQIYSVSDYFRDDPKRMLSMIKIEQEYWPELLKKITRRCHQGLVYKGNASILFSNILTLPINVKTTPQDRHFFVSGILKLSEWLEIKEDDYVPRVWNKVRNGKPEKNVSIAIKIILCLGGKRDKSVRLSPQYLKTIKLINQSLYSEEKILSASAKSVVKGALNLVEIPDHRLSQILEIYEKQDSWN